VTWHPLAPVEAGYFDAAPFIYRYPVELPVPPERVWASLTSDHALKDWRLGLPDLHWTSPRPFGVGTTRSVTLPAWLITVHERFFRWEEGARMSFAVYEANRPLLTSLAEDYLVEPIEGGCRFTWTMAFTPTDRVRRAAKAGDRLNRRLCRAVPIRAKAYFARHPAG